MGSSIHLDLSWLVPVPNDHAERCIALSHSSGSVGLEARALSDCRLDAAQLSRLSRSLEAARSAGCSFDPLLPLSLGLLTHATASGLELALIASAPRHGFSVQITTCHYGQAMQDALFAGSGINQARPAIVICALDHRWYPMSPCVGNAARAAAIVEECIAQLRALVDAVRSNSGATCLLQTLALPTEPLFGSLDRTIPGTPLQLTEALNQRIVTLAKDTESILFDVCSLAAMVGTANWFDPAGWNEAKLPMHRSVLPLYGEHVMRLVAAHRGKARRCLILDLDNTVWGGVIGDDGVEGIKLGQGDAVGEAHLDVQRFALSLRARGIVLAICSKNTDEIARLPFVQHPDMLLKLDHIAVFQANWSDKASNIQAIANELSLGLESMVFMDDNPMERDIVRRMLPQVAVPELPHDPADYVRTVSAGGYFDSTRFSTEDLGRANFYQDNSRRAALKQQAGDIQSYLASLEMQITFQPFDETGRARIAQLISKSNQFNLTTRRYSESDVAAVQVDPLAYTLQVRLTDIFGDNGMISVVIARQVNQDQLEIDTWLMSCRVLGRCVENMVLGELLQHARARGLKTLVGRYKPTERNALVKDHYKKLGFNLISDEGSQGCVWHLSVADAQMPTAPMRVIRSNDDASSPERTLASRTAPAASAAVPIVVASPPQRPGKNVETANRVGRTLGIDEMIRIWSDVFLRKGLEPDANFFDLGGDSLAALNLVQTVSDQIGRRIPLNAIVDAPTLSAFTRAVNCEVQTQSSLLVNLHAGDEAKTLFIVHGYGGSVMELRPLAQALRGAFSVVGLRASGLEAGEPIYDTVEAMAEVYLSAMRERQPHGPYWLAGYSSGGLVAYEMAQRLRAAGESVSGVVLLDTVLHQSYWTPRVWVEFVMRRSGHHLRRAFRSSAPLRHLADTLGSLWGHARRGFEGMPAIEHEPLAGLPEAVKAVRVAGLRAHDQYAPTPSALPLLVIRSDLHLSALPDPVVIWRQLSSQVQFADAPGNHLSMIALEHVHSLAAALHGLLATADVSGGLALD